MFNMEQYQDFPLGAFLFPIGIRKNQYFSEKEHLAVRL